MRSKKEGEFKLKRYSSSEIRHLFLQYFKENNHDIEPSASLVPKDDPSLLWINSGVATLKRYFDGSVVPENPRIVNAQKAVRTNDIENVGYTTRHHTFFEMLGNFSIGDYFKKEAIFYAWDFLTSKKWMGFDKDLLSVTVHPEDDEAYDIWLQEIKLPEHQIIRLEENFWDIGEGPSGPNTEIFYDRGPSFGNDPNDSELYPGGENDRYLEIWNLVFSQFNHNPDDTYTPLPNKNIDTGMGLERMACIVQNTPTNFETDLFMPIIKKVEQYANVHYGENETSDTAFKVIVDHIRTVAFAIGDHALPSNEGRGYVLRRLLRRAVRFAKKIGIDNPFMYDLVGTVGEIMVDYYPEVSDQQEHIEQVIKNEENRFHETLNDGLAMLQSIITKEQNKKSKVFPGVEVFKLYDTYGFPKELTEEYVGEYGFSIDEKGFEEEMEKQRSRARQAMQKVDSMQVQSNILHEIDIESPFIGYDYYESDAIVEYIIANDQFVNSAKEGDDVFVILSTTPFYAESGGQVADNGWIISNSSQAYVKDVKTGPLGQHIHQIEVKHGEITTGDEVIATINDENRKGIIKNHTATHLLHQALKDVLGEHVNQAGSLVATDRLRFDFSHFSSVSDADLTKIEQIVNKQIWKSTELVVEHKEKSEAEAMGAMALFGEKYGDIVRVVQINDYSIELCGGCHVNNTSEIGLFKILSESGIGAGIRRIEAVTSKDAYHFMNEKVQSLQTSANLLKVSEEEVQSKISNVLEEMKELKRKNDSLSTKLSNIEAKSLTDHIREVKGVNILAQKVNVSDMGQLRNMVDEMKQELTSGIILLASENNNKVQLAAGISNDLIDKGFHAGDLIKQAAKICGGGGGGRPDMAQAGGTKPENIVEALQFATKYVKELLE